MKLSKYRFTIKPQRELIGRAVEYMPYFIFAFEEVGRVGVGKNKANIHLKKLLV